MKERNIENFKNWLDKNLKSECYNFEACLDELETRYCATSNKWYELSKFETKSGLPEIFTYNVEIVEAYPGEYEMIFVF